MAKSILPLAALSAPIDGSTGAAVQIFPAGEFSVPRGAVLGAGPWRMDAAAAERLLVNIGALTNDVLIDYEHHSLYTDKGVRAEAAGWAPRDGFEWREGRGFFHRGPQWTDEAIAAITARKYRYTSAIFSYDPETGHPVDLVNFTLTNQPAIDGMQPLAAASARLLAATSTLTPEMPVDELLEQLRWMLNLPLSAGATEILAELNKLRDKITGDAAMAATARGNLVDYIAALKALPVPSTPDPALYVPVGVVESLKSDLAALSAKLTASEVEDLIQPALSDGRLLPAQEAWARDLGRANLAALKSYLDTAQPIAALRGSQTQGQPPAGTDDTQPTAEELAVCKQLGITPEQYAAGKADLRTRFGAAA